MLEEPGLFALPSSAHCTRRVNGRQHDGGTECSEHRGSCWSASRDRAARAHSLQASRRPCPFFQHAQLSVCTCFLLIVDQLVCPPLRAEPFDRPAFKPSASDAHARARSQVRNSLSAAWHRRRGGEADSCATCGVEGLRVQRRFAGNTSRSPSTIDTACAGSATF